MECNDVLRKVRYAFDINDKTMVEIFKEGGADITEAGVVNRLKKEENPGYKECSKSHLTAFLNGLIIHKRGRKEEKPGQVKKVEEKLNNNLIMKKLKIALDFKSEDMLEVLKLADVEISKSELSAIFRKKGHRNYKECGDRYLRNFLKGLGIKYREHK